MPPILDDEAKDRGGHALLMRLLRDQPRLLWVVVALAMLGPLVMAPQPYLGKIIIDDIIFQNMAAGDTSPVSNVLGIPLTIWMLAGIVVLGIALRTLGTFIGGWQSHVILLITRNAMHDLRLNTAARVMGAPQQFFETNGPGRVAARITNDPGHIDGAIFSLLRNLLTAVFTVVVVVIFMLWLNPWLTLVVAATMPITAVLSLVSYRRLRRFAREESDRTAALNNICTETFAAVKVIRSFSAEPAFLQRIQERCEALRFEGIRHWTTWHTVHGLLSLLTNLGGDIFLFVGGILAMRGDISFGEFFAFSAYQGMLWGPINTVLQTGQTIQVGSASADRVNELLMTDQEPYLLRPGHNAPEKFVGQVQAENMGFSYDGREEVLRDIDLQVQPGTMTALVGHSGSGKTTFAGLLLGMYLPTRGKLLVDGRDVREWDLRQLRHNVGVVLQDSVLFDDTVRGNLCLGRTDFHDTDLWQALEAAHLSDTVRQMPEGLDTMVGQNGTKLSGGQRQRMAIARVFLRDPQLLILDEATSALDSETERQIQASFDALMQGRTSIVIAHRLSTIYRAQQIIVLHQGRIVERGTHQELVEREGGHYQQLYRAQVEAMLPMSGSTRRPWESRP